jgi:hypothetical protein
MDLAQKFEAARSTDAINISKLDVGLEYPVLLATRATTRHGPTIVLTLLDNEVNTVVKVFLPSRYYSVFTDPDIEAINSQKVHYDFIYNGQNEKTRAYDVTLKQKVTSE